MLTVLTQCTSKWKRFQTFGSNSVLYWILNCGKSSSNWNSQTNASRLWWSVCWCEYSKTLGKAVQRWRIGASRFEWQNTNWKAFDEFQKVVQLGRKCIDVRGNFVENIFYFFFISLKYIFPFIFYLSGGKTYQPALVLKSLYITILQKILNNNHMNFNILEQFNTLDRTVVL
jgi:hypothetical protein